MLPHETRSDVENRHASELSRLRAENERLTAKYDRACKECFETTTKLIAAEARGAKAVENILSALWELHRAENERLTAELHNRINWWSEEYSKVCDRANAAEAREAKAVEAAIALFKDAKLINQGNGAQSYVIQPFFVDALMAAIRALPTEVQNDA